MCSRFVLCYIGNSGVDVDCSLIATLYHSWMFGKFHLIILTIH